MIMSMIIVSIIGRDRPGMLAELATLISGEGGNIENISGHTIYIERGKKIANISMLISSDDIGVLYQRLLDKLNKFAEENNLVINMYPVGHILGEKKERMQEIE